MKPSVTRHQGAPHSSPEVDPVTGLQLYELSHPWGHGSPTYPGFDDVQVRRSVTHARHGVMSQRITTVMHSGTHLNAPRHLIQGGLGVGELELSRFFGSGVVLSVPKQPWELITAEDLESAQPTVRESDIVLLVTGWHTKYSDSQEYFAHSPGLSEDGAGWLVKRGVKLVGVDTPSVDHPLATTLGEHRGGGLAPYLVPRYEAQTGRRAKDDFPRLNPAHRLLLGAGIPTVENVGGDVRLLCGRRVTMQCFPWRWNVGDACVVRLVALHDEKGDYRLETGAVR